MPKLPPTHKWLVEKRARLQGTLEHKTHMLQLTVARMEPKLAKLRADVDAMDRALCVFDFALAGTSVKPVNPWQGDYGPRGSLRKFVRSVLKERAPAPIGTDDMAALIVEHFALKFDLPSMRRRWAKNTVLNALRDMVNEGLAERLHEGQSGFVGQWRWKLQRPATLAELRAASTGRDQAGSSS